MTWYRVPSRGCHFEMFYDVIIYPVLVMDRTVWRGFAQASDSGTLIFILHKIHVAILSFSYVFRLLDSSLSAG